MRNLYIVLGTPDYLTDFEKSALRGPEGMFHTLEEARELANDLFEKHYGEIIIEKWKLLNDDRWAPDSQIDYSDLLEEDTSESRKFV